MENTPVVPASAPIQTAEIQETERPKVSSVKADSAGVVIFEPALITDRAGPLTVAEAVARYITLRVAEGLPEGGDTHSHMIKHLSKRLCERVGSMPLKTIKADHIRQWSTELKNERSGRPLDILTKRHHLISVKTFFRRCWREGWIERDPTLPIVLPHVEERDVNVIQARDAFEFFKVNRDHRAVGRVALEAFGGLRYTTAGKIVKADLKFDRHGIEMPSTKHKSRKRKFRQGHPGNLWAWLKHAPEDCWALNFRQYREEKKEMLVLARMRPMVLKSDADRDKARDLKNVWRHSFASYLLAKAKDYAPIAYLMQHARATTTEVYEGIADDFDAHLYFAITPQSVLMSWEEFKVAVRGTMSQQPAHFTL